MDVTSSVGPCVHSSSLPGQSLDRESVFAPRPQLPHRPMSDWMASKEAGIETQKGPNKQLNTQKHARQELGWPINKQTRRETQRKRAINH